MQSLSFKKARFVLEYSLGIAVLAGLLLTMQNYLKRSLQGQIKVNSEQIGEQYDYGFTQSHERFSSDTNLFEVTTAGWNHPTTYIHTEGSFCSDSERSLKPLKARPPR